MPCEVKGEMALTPANIRSGLELADDGPFDSMLIKGESDDPGPVSLQSLVIEVISSVSRLDSVFSIDIQSRWSWESGEKLTVMRGDVEKDLKDCVMAIHEGLDKKDMVVISKFFGAKAADMAKALGKAPAVMEQQQEQFFKSMMAGAGWGMTPLERADLTWFLVNDRVVKIETLQGGEPLVSHEINQGKNGAGKLTIPLYMARISGMWVVVR